MSYPNTRNILRTERFPYPSYIVIVQEQIVPNLSSIAFFQIATFTSTSNYRALREITMTISQIYLSIALALATTSKTYAADSLQCAAAKDTLFNIDSLSSASELMWKTYEKMCDLENSCIFTVEPVAATTHLNFERLEQTTQYDNLREACDKLGTPEFPSSLCTVNSDLTVSNGASGTGAVRDHFTARNEPVCFPYECTHRQVEMVHGNPLGCDPEKTDCILDAEEADCGTRPAGAGSGNCFRYAEMFNSDDNLVSSINALSSKASMACVSFQTDDALNPICATETNPIKINIAQHMRKFEANLEYDKYISECYDSGGQTCFISVAAKLEGQVGFFEIEVRGDYNDYPACLPGDCDSEEKKAFMRKLVADDVGRKIRDGMADGFRRHLTSETELQLHKDELDRFLQNGDDYCPGVGMEICDFKIMDFYCIARGTQTGPLTMGGTSDATRSAITSASFAAAMGVAVAGGMLL